MATARYVTLSTGNLVQVAASTTSAGTGSSGLIPALNASGLIDTTMLAGQIVVAGAAGTVPLSVKGSASQTGNLLNISSSSGTADLAYFKSDGTLMFPTTGNGVNFGNGAMTINAYGSIVSASNFTITGYINTGSVGVGVTSKTAAYTAQVGPDHTIFCNATTAAFTVTLPSAATYPANLEFVIKKTDASVNVVTVATTSSQTIDGTTTRTLATQYKYIIVQSNGTSWYIIGSN